ncbi:hypothetical protein GCU56_01145 [Geodermatophilus sabuli]|uniref:RNA polymerase alpha subunit C-terminal domain-containing protein n=1 Tax=Geodermatophilus sabuli TaxID=1564158 RepID=A0A7K3VV17_9ACTN|nr:DNA-directed RNA polymerase subunit alpha C-terminal domain-containing protein [Geodermatophilus sabuli]NEK56481.1 hypothetical protein [Geodermatophilus sabuli]
MPTRSRGDDVPARTIQDLGLPPRAVTALTRAGIVRIEDLAALTRRDLAAVAGLGPGLVTAIRLVVPEPASGGSRAEEESPDAPAIPSFASLRGPRRHTAIDLLVPEPPAPAATPSGAPAATPSATPTGTPRPAEYADLLRLGLRAARAVAGVPGRLALWSVRAPVRGLRRLLGVEPGTDRG